MRANSALCALRFMLVPFYSGKSPRQRTLHECAGSVKPPVRTSRLV
jgi:hypothetical protein